MEIGEGACLDVIPNFVGLDAGGLRGRCGYLDFA